jgi:type VI secretion system protein ImpK
MSSGVVAPLPPMANWSDLFSPVFGFVLELQQSLSESKSSEPPKASAVMQRAREAFLRVETAARAARLREDMVNQARFAAVALIDEIVMRSRWSMREDWARQPLAFEFFKEANAGEEFFVRMELLQRNSRPDADARGALEVFVTSISLGFRGRYVDPAGFEELRGLQRDAAQLVSDGVDPNRLSPAWQMRESAGQRLRRLPTWLLVALGFGVTTVVWCVFQIMIQWDASNLASSLK